VANLIPCKDHADAAVIARFPPLIIVAIGAVTVHQSPKMLTIGPALLGSRINCLREVFEGFGRNQPVVNQIFRFDMASSDGIAED